MTILLVGLFLVFQAASYSHEMQFDGDELHQECVVCSVVTEDLDIDPALLAAKPDLEMDDGSFEEPSVQIRNLVDLTPFGRAPPPRAPPVSLI